MLRCVTSRCGGVVTRYRMRAASPRHLCTSNPKPSEDSVADNVRSEEAGKPGDAEGGSGEPDLAEKLAEKDAAILELNDRVLRGLAEMENVRSIARRDVDNAREYGIASFAKGLLGVADNLGLALRAVPQERIDSDESVRGLHSGVEATERELQKVLSQNGVVKFGAVGDAFDPNRHQALFEAPDPSVEPGTVVDVTKTGYAIGERILRPAEVGVSKA